MPKRSRRITSADVARASGVSRATVSYVLNNDPRQTIPPETRQRVLDAAEALGYQPFAPARILRAGYSTLALAVIQFEQIDPNLALTLRNVQAGLAEHGFTLIWSVGVDPAASQTHPSANLAPAVILAYVDETDPNVTAFLQQFNVPVLPLNHQTTRGTVGREQANYLIGRGWQRLVFAAPDRRDVRRVAQARQAGVEAVCAERGLVPPVVEVVPLDRDGARAAMARMLEQVSPPFGVCCYNDEVAFATLAALADLRVAVPEQVAVIGCDDIPLAAFSQPALTTLRFDNRRFLDALIANVLAASSHEATEPMPQVAVALIERGSA